jgi:hypothetical protein
MIASSPAFLDLVDLRHLPTKPSITADGISKFVLSLQIHSDDSLHLFLFVEGPLDVNFPTTTTPT